MGEGSRRVWRRQRRRRPGTAEGSSAGPEHARGGVNMIHQRSRAQPTPSALLARSGTLVPVLSLLGATMCALAQAVICPSCQLRKCRAPSAFAGARGGWRVHQRVQRKMSKVLGIGAGLERQAPAPLHGLPSTPSKSCLHKLATTNYTP